MDIRSIPFWTLLSLGVISGVGAIPSVQLIPGQFIFLGLALIIVSRFVGRSADQKNLSMLALITLLASIFAWSILSLVCIAGGTVFFVRQIWLVADNWDDPNAY